MKDTRKSPRPFEPPKVGAGECGATHVECSNTWKGNCDRAAGHDGSHHCNQCQGLF